THKITYTLYIHTHSTYNNNIIFIYIFFFSTMNNNNNIHSQPSSDEVERETSLYNQENEKQQQPLLSLPPSSPTHVVEDTRPHLSLLRIFLLQFHWISIMFTLNACLVTLVPSKALDISEETKSRFVFIN